MIISKKTLGALVIVIGMSLMAGCGKTDQVVPKQAKQQWEYKIAYFDRDKYKSISKELEALGNEGWEYAGTLVHDGMNAQVVAFKRPKQE